MASIATLKRMSAAQLSDLLLAGPAATTKLAIVDVRDDGQQTPRGRPLPPFSC